MRAQHLDDWIAPETLAGWVMDSRQRVMDLVADLSDEQMIGPKLATVNPLIWEIGHLAWFQEKFVLRALLGHAPIIAHADALWDSGAIPHDTRWHLDLPTRAQTLEYMDTVRTRIAEAVAAPGASDVLRHFALYTVYHDDVHTEAITYTRQSLGYPAPVLPGLSDTFAGQADPGALTGDVEIAGGGFLLGATRGQPFAYDNEKWAHEVEVAPFALAKAPVTQAEFAAFVGDGGYARRELWRHDGWEWRQEANADHPLYWRPDGDGWQRHHFGDWRPLEADRPVIHVNYYEVDAYARWAGRRLPTEVEWEFAASAAGHGDKRRYPWGDAAPWETPPEIAAKTAPEQPYANLDWRAGDTVDVAAASDGDSADGLRQLFGNVWEWTSSTFAPYPNFERDAYAENSQPWFYNRKVLRGGAWATRGRYLRNTYRNYFTLERRDILAGVRTAALDDDQPAQPGA